MNCSGIHDKDKRTKMFEYIKELHCDMYCLQDTHFTHDLYRVIYTEWGAYCYFSCGTSNSRGVAILFSNTLDYKINESLVDDNGNYVILDISVQENQFTLVSLYGPNRDNPEFYKNIFKLIDEIENESYIICGDFNLIQNPDLDYYKYKHINHNKSHTSLKTLWVRDISSTPSDRNIHI